MMIDKPALALPELKSLADNPIVARPEGYECTICSVQITSSSDDNNLKLHIEGLKHLKKLSYVRSQLKFLSSVLYLDQNSLLSNQIIKYFKRFGNVIKYVTPQKDGSHPFILFDSPDSVSRALSNGDTYFIMGSKIRAFRSPRAPIDSIFSGQEKVKFIPKIFFLNAYRFPDVFSEIKYLYSLEGLTDVDKKSSTEFTRNLSKILAQLYMDSNLLPYGSRTLSLPIKNSDIDLTLLIKEENGIKDMLQKIKDYKPLKKVCYRILLIPSKRFPILKMYGRNIEVSIDLSINNYLALRNNDLVRKYLSLSRLFDANEMGTLEIIIYVIKLWRRQNLLSGNPFCHINSYGWILLIIFYLQHIKYLPSLQLPKISRIRSGISLSEHMSCCRIKNFNCDFVNNITIFEPPAFKPDVMDIIIGFFSFYSQEFNFEEHVIDVRTGGDQRIEKSSCVNNLVSVLDGPTRLLMSKNFNKPIVIQDPFELSHNIARNLCHCLLRELIGSIKSTLKKIQDSILELSKTGSSNGISRLSLYSILTPSVDETCEVMSIYQVIFRPINGVKIEFFIESVVCLVLNTLFHCFRSSIKFFNIRKPNDVSVMMEPKIIPHKMFSEFDIDKFEDLVFEIITPNVLYYGFYPEKRKLSQDMNGSAISTNLIDYKMTFRFDINRKLLTAKFSLPQSNREPHETLYTQIEEQLERIESPYFEIF